MAFIRSIEILKEINTVFEPADFELQAKRTLHNVHQYKLQPVVNVNGTVTVVASHTRGAATYLTFSGNGTVELLPQCKIFRIDRKTQEPVQIRRQFRNMLEKECGFEFKNGGHYALAGETRSDMLCPRIIPQIFQVFQESDFLLLMCSTTYTSWSKRLNISILPDGRLGITIGVENLEHRYSYADMVIVLLDGSDTVSITSLSDIHSEADLYDSDKLHTVAIENARQILTEQYGVSFEELWHMNEAPIFDSCGIPYDPNYGFQTDGTDVEEIADSDMELIHGYFFAEQALHKIVPDHTVLEADEAVFEILEDE